jgi:integrase/recombinase XerD
MKVQRVRLPEIEHITWLVLDDDYVPIEPILRYLKFLDDLERSPNTIRATAQHLKTFWQFLQNAHLDWTEIDVAHLATFIQWLRHPDPVVMSIDLKPVKRTNATIDQMLSSITGLYVKRDCL